MYLMHRISHEHEQAKKLLESQSKLSIGYGDLGRNKQTEKVLAVASKRDKRDFAKFFVDLGAENGLDWMTRVRSYSLYNFLQLSAGDTVFVPSPGKFSIYEVTGIPEGLPAEAVDNADLGFAVPVKIIAKGLSRDDYLGSTLTSKFKVRWTNLVLSADEVHDLLNNLDHKTTIANFSETKNEIIKNVQAYIDELSPHQFELLVKSYLENLGADRTDIPAKNGKYIDNKPVADVDVLAQFVNLGIVIQVQVKHHKGEESAKDFKHAVAQLVETKFTGIEEYDSLIPVKWLIITATVDNKLIDSIAPQNIRVIQGKEFAELLVDSGLTINEETFTNISR
jgi:hypothetical protein